MANDNLLQCYNRGCGQKYDPNSNKDDSCRHHPGDPFFHDAYKGWSCCNKKCTDFTEFLNIKGCQLSKHSNIKPPEPEKPVNKDIPDTEVIEVKPIVPSALERPPLDSPLIVLKPEIAPSLKQQLDSSGSDVKVTANDSNEITIGTVCKNGGCGKEYSGPETNETTCVHHPGVPIFHEGMKFWSCCQKKTTDFNAFLSQVGCEHGTHVWKKDDNGSQNIQCRWDHHQTGSHVVVSIYAKQYCPIKSTIKLNPIRLCVNLIFPQQSNGIFNLDVELQGIVNVEASQVSMYGTKVEIKLKKAEPGAWSKLYVQKMVQDPVENKPKGPVGDRLAMQVEAVDLDDL
ncbi:cysteine and histidine-rich domain-containing protein morgana [Aethina tumida]|uniref:cysteine and histidine-rich domain-containing protein morgana n=1 Tax=Aethina tumida TaxID=116153 RepID=UPI0021475B69|nr:cysteine and histidine-rich domain-containing protein morgana [Aethina tumida]